ncbi:response regulator transcription factor [Streptomyces sp. NPDC005141]
MGDFSARAYGHMLDLAVAIVESRDPQMMWRQVGEHVIAALGATTTIFLDLDSRSRTGSAQAWAPEWVGRTPLQELVPRRMEQGHPLFLYTARGERLPVTADEISDRRAWHASEAFQEAYEIYGTTRQMTLPFFTPRGLIRGFILGRPGCDFTKAEVEFARRIQPLLTGADRHVRELRCLAHRTFGEGDTIDVCGAAARHGITPREVVVVGLLAEGLTAAAIGRRLAISAHTVKRHLESIYRKLGTHDRLSTVLVAQQLRLVAARPE